MPHYNDLVMVRLAVPTVYWDNLGLTLAFIKGLNDAIYNLAPRPPPYAEPPTEQGLAYIHGYAVGLAYRDEPG